jgi:toxin-antitoxin system PIN domain toxin
MRLVDTNVLIYAHRRDSERHAEYRDWVTAMIGGPEPYAVSDFAVNGMVRVATNPRAYPDPTPLDRALAFAAEIRNQPHSEVVSPGPRFWPIFTDLCRSTKAHGKLIPDAYLAALAIEHGCEFFSEDRDFGRFPGLRWRRPLD